jgi:hypothetical protein
MFDIWSLKLRHQQTLFGETEHVFYIKPLSETLVSATTGITAGIGIEFDFEVVFAYSRSCQFAFQ